MAHNSHVRNRKVYQPKESKESSIKHSADWSGAQTEEQERQQRELQKFKAIAMQLLDENDQLKELNTQIANEVEKYSTVEVKADPELEKEIEEISKKQEELEKLSSTIVEKQKETEKKSSVHERLYNLRKVKK